MHTALCVVLSALEDLQLSRERSNTYVLKLGTDRSWSVNERDRGTFATASTMVSWLKFGFVNQRGMTNGDGQ